MPIHCIPSPPGSAHEEAGRQLLLAHGISPELARFAATHASWTRPGSVGALSPHVRAAGIALAGLAFYPRSVR
jgi:hypothetical protein